MVWYNLNLNAHNTHIWYVLKMPQECLKCVCFFFNNITDILLPFITLFVWVSRIFSFWVFVFLSLTVSRHYTLYSNARVCIECHVRSLQWLQWLVHRCSSDTSTAIRRSLSAWQRPILSVFRGCLRLPIERRASTFNRAPMAFLVSRPLTLFESAVAAAAAKCSFSPLKHDK